MPLYTLGDLLNPHPNSTVPPGGSQKHPVKTSLHGLNNHSELRTPQSILEDLLRSNSSQLPRSEVTSTSSGSVGFKGANRRPSGKAIDSLRARSPGKTHTPRMSIAEGPKRRLITSPNDGPSSAKRIKPSQTSQEDPPAHLSQLDKPHGQRLSRELTKAESNYLETLTSTGMLDEMHTQFARDLAEVAGDSYRHLAMSFNFAKTHFLHHQTQAQVALVSQQMASQYELLEKRILNQFNIITETIRDLTDAVHSGQIAKPAPTPIPAARLTLPEKSKHQPWEASTELKSLLTSVSVELMPKANLQAYTAVEDRAKKYLSRSLFNSVKIRVSEGDKEWLGRHLPVKIRGVNDGKGLRDYDTAIREACKHSREKLHLLLLTNITKNLQGADNKVPVPTLQDLWHRIAIKCGVIADSVEAHTAWASADDTTRSRIAYLRREAARLRKTPSSSNIWSAVDRQLDILLVMDREDPDYSAKFYNIIYQEDHEIFDGKRSWFEIQRDFELTLPNEATFLASPCAAHVELKAPNGIDNEGEEDKGEAEEHVEAGVPYANDEAEPLGDRGREEFEHDEAEDIGVEDGEEYEHEEPEEIGLDDGYNIGLHSEE
ncbi:hypothetical protein DFH28DRAFT_900067 [Melampsora americana]|nr:hypothetical protein DFH28DRAFT_900067 [Melampsora americana]